MIDLTQKLIGITRIVKQSIRPERGGPEKKVNLKFDFSNCTIDDILTWAIADRKIAWRNPNQKHWDSIVNGQTIDVSPSSPGKRVETPEETKARMKAQFKAMNAEEKQAYLEELEAEMNE